MKVLVACEFSGIVRDAFLRRGHDALSCDLLPTESEGPHFQGPVEDLLMTDSWDLLIAHPPCRYLTRAGARWWNEPGWAEEQEKALQFVRLLLEAPVPYIAVENPPGRIGTQIRPADQYIQPWQFGHGEKKMTGLWLKGLPELLPTNIVEGREPRVHHAAPGPNRWKERSRFFPGIAEAMADQWPEFILASQRS